MRRGLVLALVAGLAAALAVPALAVPPVRTTISQQGTLANPTACGSYGVEWNINLTVEQTTYFDDQGRRTHVIGHVRENNTVRNTVTGLTLQEGPDDFVQTTYFDPETGLRTLDLHQGRLRDRAPRGRGARRQGEDLDRRADRPDHRFDRAASAPRAHGRELQHRPRAAGVLQHPSPIGGGRRERAGRRSRVPRPQRCAGGRERAMTRTFVPIGVIA